MNVRKLPSLLDGCLHGLFVFLLDKIRRSTTASHVPLFYHPPAHESFLYEIAQISFFWLIYSHITHDCCYLSSGICDFYDREFYMERWTLQCLQQGHDVFTKPPSLSSWADFQTSSSVTFGLRVALHVENLLVTLKMLLLVRILCIYIYCIRN